MEAAPHKAAAVRPPTTHHENYQLDEPDMRDTAGEVRTSGDIYIMTKMSSNAFHQKKKNFEKRKILW